MTASHVPCAASQATTGSVATVLVPRRRREHRHAGEEARAPRPAGVRRGGPADSRGAAGSLASRLEHGHDRAPVGGRVGLDLRLVLRARVGGRVARELADDELAVGGHRVDALGRDDVGAGRRSGSRPARRRARRRSGRGRRRPGGGRRRGRRGGSRLRRARRGGRARRGRRRRPSPACRGAGRLRRSRGARPRPRPRSRGRGTRRPRWRGGAPAEWYGSPHHRSGARPPDPAARAGRCCRCDYLSPVRRPLVPSAPVSRSGRRWKPGRRTSRFRD